MEATERVGVDDRGAEVSFRDVTVESKGVRILHSVNATVPRGSFTAVIGPNGAGKTTLLLTLLGQVTHRGAISIQPPQRDRSVRIGYVPQRLDFDRGMPLTVTEVMVMGHQRLPLWFGAKRLLRQKAMEMLEAVGAAHLAERNMGALSGGEQQRVLLALALQNDPELLILDEPSAGMDYRGEQLLCGLLERLRTERGFTQLMVSHDLAVVTAHATHVICLNRAVICEGSPERVLSSEVLEATFGIHRGIPDPRGLPRDAASLDVIRRCKECRWPT